MGRQPLPTDTIVGNGTDHYRIDTVLGPGGFGVTYLARDLRFERDVAIKEYFPAEFAYRDGSTTIRSAGRGADRDFFDQGKRYFIEEARTLGKFRHEHIVRVINLFEQFNTAYMVLEFEEGQSLKSWLRTLGRRPSQAEIDAILEPLLSALELIHSKGMFHRDIAPDNIIIRPDGRPVLIDFGAARNFVRENSFTIGAIVKHGYSPPEQYTLDTKLQGAWSDIYSLSATLYFAVMGEPPEEAAKRQLGDTVLPIEQHLDGYHRGLYRPSLLTALNAGLALKPAGRPQTVAAFRAILDGADLVAQPSVHVRGSSASASVPAELVAAGAEGTVIREAALLQSSASGHRPLSRSLAAGVPAAGDVVSNGADGSLGATPILAGAIDATPSGDAVVARTGYPEATMRTASIVALAVAGSAAAVFLMLGGIEHPGGMAAAILVCAGLVGAGIERSLSLAWADRADVRLATAPTAAMLLLSLAIFWVPLTGWRLAVPLVAVAGVAAIRRLERWVPTTLVAFSLLHLVGALGLLLVLSGGAAGAIKINAQQDPLLLPIMAGSLVVIAGLMLTTALQIRRRAEGQGS